MSAYKSSKRVVINVYCSSSANHRLFIGDLLRFIDNFSDQQELWILGDFNIDYIKDNNNIVIRKLKEHNFNQIVSKPTHNQGNLLDHIYIRNVKLDLQVVHHSITWLDHDILHVIGH